MLAVSGVGQRLGSNISVDQFTVLLFPPFQIIMMLIPFYFITGEHTNIVEGSVSLLGSMFLVPFSL